MAEKRQLAPSIGQSVFVHRGAARPRSFPARRHCVQSPRDSSENPSASRRRGRSRAFAPPLLAAAATRYREERAAAVDDDGPAQTRVSLVLMSSPWSRFGNSPSLWMRDSCNCLAVFQVPRRPAPTGRVWWVVFLRVLAVMGASCSPSPEVKKQKAPPAEQARRLEWPALALSRCASREIRRCCDRGT